MSYEVKIVADSVGPNGARVTTFQLKYPRMIHAEFLTHRMVSRNASSTRAIPTAKMIEWIERDPAMPVYWGKNQKGMVATEELSESKIERATEQWLLARDAAVNYVEELMELGVHKQIASRILEPWAHINVVATATSWDNFFALRCDKNAMPEIQSLAVKMARAYRDSIPVEMEAGWWHLPYVTEEELAELCEARADTYEPLHLEQVTLLLLKYSVARCARVSYLTFDGKSPDPSGDIYLHDTLVGNGHWSPLEHQAEAQLSFAKHQSGNFVGWSQYRQSLRTSVHKNFDFRKLAEFGDWDFIV